MKFSIIVPVKAINDYIRTAIPHYQNLRGDYELLIFPDFYNVEEHADDEALFATLKGRVKVIPSGETGPAEKRDMALEYATGDVYAFIDDDAYPREDWLEKAMSYFADDSVGAVGGPAVTAPEDSIRQKASGKIYESKLCSGQYTYRYLPEEKRDVDDLPSVNLIVRADLFREIGGYDSNYWPGEDTKLCLDIVNQGKRIVYDPEIYVFHHRRTVFKAHLKQATNYGKHRGYFAKVLPQTSLKLGYMIPSAFVIGLVAGPILSLFFSALWYVYFGVIAFYFLMVGASIRKPGGLCVWFLAVIGIFLTHVGYGINFIRGYCSKELLR